MEKGPDLEHSPNAFGGIQVAYDFLRLRGIESSEDIELVLVRTKSSRLFKDLYYPFSAGVHNR